jgi:dynein heavy chain 2
MTDTDTPYVFGLPDNIERSLQRTNSAAVIKQLRALSAVDVEGAKYDREKWRALVRSSYNIFQNLNKGWNGQLGLHGV